MKLNSDVLVEIVNIIQSGLLRKVDVSQRLRDLDLVEKDNGLSLSETYVALNKEL